MNRLDNCGMSLARRLCLMQTVAGGAIAVGCYVLVGSDSARAAMFGVLAAIVPPFFFAWRALSVPRGGPPDRLVAAMYRGEAGKLLLVGVLFGLGVKLYPQHLVALLLTYMVCLAVYWGGMVYLASVDDRKQHGRS